MAKSLLNSFPLLALISIIGVSACSGANQFSQVTLQSSQKSKSTQNANGGSNPTTSAFSDTREVRPLEQMGPNQPNRAGGREVPTIDVAGVNLVADCLMVDNLSPIIEGVPNGIQAEVNCMLEFSAPSNITLVNPRMEGVHPSGQKMLMPEMRDVVSTQGMVAKVELIFVTRDSNAARLMGDTPSMVLKVDKLKVNANTIENVSLPITMRNFLLQPKACLPTDRLSWKRYTLRWENTLARSPTINLDSRTINEVSQQLIASISPALPEAMNPSLCGARFVGEMKKIKRDGKELAADKYFYSDRMLFMLNSMVLASDDLWKPMGMRERPLMMSLLNPMETLLNKMMSNILNPPSSKSEIDAASLARQQDTYCLGNSSGCFSKPVGSLTNEFTSFNPADIAPQYLQAALSQALSQGSAPQFVFQVFGNGANGDGVDGLNPEVNALEVDIELAF